VDNHLIDTYIGAYLLIICICFIVHLKLNIMPTNRFSVNHLTDLKRVKFRKLFIIALIIFITGFITTKINGQVVAGFTYSRESTCAGTDVQFNNTSLGANKYHWDFSTGYADITNEVNPVHTFQDGGVFTVTLTATNTTTMESDVYSENITVDEAANLDFDISGNQFCRDASVEFTWKPADASFDSLRWEFGNRSTTDESNPIYNSYTTNGTYNVMLISVLGVCRDTAIHPVDVSGPLASFTMSDSELCPGDSVTFELVNAVGVNSFSWYPDGASGTAIPNVNPYTHTYNYTGEVLPELLVTSSTEGSCILTDTTVTIYRVESKFGFKTVTEFCDGRNVYFDNESVGNDNNLWYLDNGSTSTEREPIIPYSTGDYVVSLRVSNNFGCSDSTSNPMTINDNPLLVVGPDTVICAGDSVQLWASGGDEVIWTPDFGLNNNTSYTPNASPSQTVTYLPEITNNTTGCSTMGDGDTLSLTLTVIQPPTINVSFEPADTTIFLGETVQIVTDSVTGYLYMWTPDDGTVDCINCAAPRITPAEKGEHVYTVLVSDFYNCGSEEFYVNINAMEDYTVGIPEAFTPNGDDINDDLCVNGRGIVNLVEFSIYNRWGNKVFSTDNIDECWDGTIDGKDQRVDTYTFYIKAEMANGTTMEERGPVSLYR
jgi:gliding motility-associated-like protein